VDIGIVFQNCNRLYARAHLSSHCNKTGCSAAECIFELGLFYNILHYCNIFFLVFGIYAHAAEESIAVGSVLFFVDFVVALMIVVAVAQAQKVLAIIFVPPGSPVNILKLLPHHNLNSIFRILCRIIL
jgi:hypothetical protein